MGNNIKDYANIFIALLLIVGLSVLGFTGADREYSQRERRYLASFPELSAESVLDGSFMDDFNSYMDDQFPGREELISLKSGFVRSALLQKDDDGFYFKDGHISRLNYPEDESRLSLNAERLKSVYNDFIEKAECNTYLSIIPDKNYFLGMDGSYPVFDYEKFSKTLAGFLDFAEYIDIFPVLSIDDYYRTDQHWDQSKITDVADTLCAHMGSKSADGLWLKETEAEFYGTYFSQSGIMTKPDTIDYFDGPGLEDYKVTDYDSGKPKVSVMYDFDKLNDEDPYEFFLSGGGAVCEIENKKDKEGKELIIFRDSFGTSIAPLMCGGYSKVTLIDLRYIDESKLAEFVDFNGQDVLFLYSTLTLNN